MCTEDPHSWLTPGKTPEKPCLHLDLTRTKDLGLRPELSVRHCGLGRGWRVHCGGQRLLVVTPSVDPSTVALGLAS